MIWQSIDSNKLVIMETHTIQVPVKKRTLEIDVTCIKGMSKELIFKTAKRYLGKNPTVPGLVQYMKSELDVEVKVPCEVFTWHESLPYFHEDLKWFIPVSVELTYQGSILVPETEVDVNEVVNKRDLGENFCFEQSGEGFILSRRIYLSNDKALDSLKSYSAQRKINTFLVILLFIVPVIGIVPSLRIYRSYSAHNSYVTTKWYVKQFVMLAIEYALVHLALSAVYVDISYLSRFLYGPLV